MSAVATESDLEAQIQAIRDAHAAKKQAEATQAKIERINAQARQAIAAVVAGAPAPSAVLPADSSAMPALRTTPLERWEDGKVIAAAEWDSFPKVREGYSSKANYVAVRNEVLCGRAKLQGIPLGKPKAERTPPPPGSAKARMDTAIDGLIAGGLDPVAAHESVKKSDPDLWKAWIAECNAPTAQDRSEEGRRKAEEARIAEIEDRADLNGNFARQNGERHRAEMKLAERCYETDRRRTVSSRQF